MSRIDSLETSIDSLNESIVKISIDAEAVGKALKEVSEKLKEIAPAGDSQRDRVPELKSDLEIFEPNDWLFDAPTKIHYYENNGEEVWY